MQDPFVPPDATVRDLLRAAKTIGVVGLSTNPSRPSYDVAEHLQRWGHRIIPINPTIESWNGIPAYPDLVSAVRAGHHIDLADVFRRPEDAGPVVDDAIAAKVPAIWFQLGVVNEEAAKKAQDAGLLVVMDRCTKIERRRLVREET